LSNGFLNLLLLLLLHPLSRGGEAAHVAEACIHRGLTTALATLCQ
jgi:hypothetical protein